MNAIKVLDANDFNTVFVQNKKKIIGSFSMGDFRKAVLVGIDIKSPLYTVINKKFKFIKNSKKTLGEIRKIFKKNKEIYDLPILNNQNHIIDIVSRKKYITGSAIKTDLIVMAGGTGKRMLSLTKELPKPLLSINNETLLSKVIKNFEKNFHLSKIYVSINFKKDLIKKYINKEFKNIQICTFSEKKPMGTVGSLTIIKTKLKDNFFLSNCDVLVEADYNDAFNFHVENKNALTIFSTLRLTQLPYGIMVPNKNGELQKMNEKPNIQSLVNCGVYIFNKKILREIPKNSYYDINQLITKLIQKKYKVMIYPVPENNWIDLGTYENFLKYAK